MKDTFLNSPQSTFWNFFSGLFFLLLLGACSIPAGMGSTVIKEFEENGISGKLTINSFNNFKVGAKGSGHYVVVPTFGKEKGYSLRLEISGHEEIHLRLKKTGGEMPSKEEMEVILETVHVGISPEKDCLAWWQDGEDEYLHILHFLDHGSLIMSYQYYQKLTVASGEMPKWNSMPSAMDLYIKKILDDQNIYNGSKDGHNAYLNHDFWDTVGDISGDAKLDDALLEVWPELFQSEELIRERCAPGAKVSEAWKAKAVNKAWDFLKKEQASDLIYSIGTPDDIYALDIALLLEWPVESKQMEKRINQNRPPISDRFRNSLQEKYRKIINDSRIAPDEKFADKNRKAADLAKSAWMAEYFEDDDAFQQAFLYSIDGWPEAYYSGVFIPDHFSKANPGSQATLLKKGAEFQGDNEAHRKRVRLIMEAHASCQQIQAMYNRDSTLVSGSLSRCQN